MLKRTRGLINTTMKDKNHYIQNRLLKNFATESGNGKYKICVMDLIKFKAEFHNTDSAFYENNLYDVSMSSDIKELETKFATVIENPMTKILNKIQSNSSEEITFTRVELETIRKYFLLQLYRTPHNRRSYINPRKNSFELSQFDIKENESKEDFWKREMLTILDSDWKSLLSTDMVGIKKHVLDINQCFIMIVKTNEEFCINDLGYVTERLSIKIDHNREQDYIQLAKELGKQLYGKDNFDDAARKEIENKSSYIDNYRLFPISSNYAILLVSPLWKIYFFEPEKFLKNIGLFSPIIMKYISLPLNTYINADKINDPQDIENNLDPNDTFTYIIHTIDEGETIFLNHLLMNEAYCFIGLKTPSKFLKTIREYNILKQNGMKNMHHDFNGFVELLGQLNK